MQPIICASTITSHRFAVVIFFTPFAALGLLGAVQDLVQRPKHGPFLLGEVAGLLHGLLGVEVVVRRVALACGVVCVCSLHVVRLLIHVAQVERSRHHVVF
jgi:hypothetical protein